MSGGMAEVGLLRERMLEGLPCPAEASSALALAASVMPDGRFPEVSYEENCPITWPTTEHLGNLYTMVWQLGRGALRVEERSCLRTASLRALEHWLERDYQSRNNWWFNEMKVPQAMLQICLLLDERDLSGERRRKSLGIIKRAESRLDDDTGANLIDRAARSLKRGVLEGDAQVIGRAAARAAKEIRIAEGEGVQADYSFHQHEAVLYNHGYGLTFLIGAVELANLVRGTRYDLSLDRIDVLSGLLLDGMQWMSRAEGVDMSAAGRGISRACDDAQHELPYTTAAMRPLLRSMMNLDPVRAPALRAMLMRCRANPGKPLVGNRHFWRSDYMAHHRKGFFFSIRMCSDRINRNDWPCNGEGLKCHHMADGCTFLMRTGREYRNIFPLWDWQRVPGSTIRTRTRLSGDMHARGRRPFAGGVSDGLFGAAAYDLVHGSLHARKAWFCFDDEVVCLGAGIRAPGPGAVATTLNQCWLRGPVRVGRGGDSEVLKSGAQDLAGVSWIRHDGVTYVFPEPVAVHLENEERSGTWSTINRAGSRDPVSGRVFQLSLDHGTAPKGAAYAYAILPGSRRKESRAEILANKPGLQAVRHKRPGITGIAFYAAGELAVPGLGRAAVDQPCLLLLREGDGGLEVTAASPVISGERLTVLLGDLPGVDAVRLTFDLPTGSTAGSSQKKQVSFTPRTVSKRKPAHNDNT